MHGLFSCEVSFLAYCVTQRIVERAPRRLYKNAFAPVVTEGEKGNQQFSSSQPFFEQKCRSTRVK